MGSQMKETVINGIGCLFGQEKLLPKRQTLVFIHGAGGSHRMWIPQVHLLSGKYNTVAINLPGHGLGRERGETTITGYAASVRDLIDGLGVDRVVLAGLSMGGAITQEAALTYPGRLSAIILFSTGARLQVMPQLLEAIRNNFEAYLRFLPEFAFARSTPQEIIAPVLEETRKRLPEIVYGDFQACDKFNLMDRVKEIFLPCLIFSGSEDRITPPKFQEYLHGQIPGSNLIRVENAGHILNLEKPREVNKAIEDFVDSLPAEEI
jgi:pimeloyl-ACP methyl ester carboxylesterase